MRRRCAAVLFDLDGTLVDSAPDMADAVNEMRIARGRPPLPLAALRPAVGSGARGMVSEAFGLHPGDAGYEALRGEFLERYEFRMLEKTRVFDGVPSLLERLSSDGLRWGIVTNKAARFALPIARAMALLPERNVFVCGDTTAHTKPHPAPLLEAVRRLGLTAGECVYVGDDLRDVQAGRAARTSTAAAAWGYLGKGAGVEAWDADTVLWTPHELLQWLEVA